MKKVNKSLYFDDDGKALDVGDFVLINDEIITMIKTNQDGERYLAAIGLTEVESIIAVEE